MRLWPKPTFMGSLVRSEMSRPKFGRDLFALGYEKIDPLAFFHYLYHIRNMTGNSTLSYAQPEGTLKIC